MTDEEKEKDKKEVPDEPEKKDDTDSKAEKEQPEKTAEPPESTDKTDVPPDTSQLEMLETENTRLKAQIEAYKTGFRSDTLEDAVILAENIAKRDGMEISAALQAVAEKYPDWKNTEENSGFKVGAEPQEENNPDESRLDNAFGIRKKKGL